MDRTINQVNFTTKEGNILSVFFNAHDNLLVVDIVHANETGGHEIVRKILNEKRLLAHCQPSIEVGTTVEDKVNSEIQTERDLRLPIHWCQFFGVEVIDPDGWRGAMKPDWNTPITRDMFKTRYQMSTCRIVDKKEYARWQHFLG